MTPTEAINTLYYDDMDILHIDNWRFFTPKKETEMIHPKDRNNTTAPMNFKRWALPLFNSDGLVPKTSKTIARSQIKCASCEICSCHLGLESPDLSPPCKDIYICDVCNRTYYWQCLLKTSCCNVTEREAIDANDSWACPACTNLNQMKRKIASSTLTEKRDCGGLMEPNLGARRTKKHV
jgi:ubiquitin C-terminal hydrolase